MYYTSMQLNRFAKLSQNEINADDGSLKYVTSFIGANSTTTDMAVVEYSRATLLIYTTTETYWGNLGGVDGADMQCSLFWN